MEHIIRWRFYVYLPKHSISMEMNGTIEWTHCNRQRWIFNDETKKRRAKKKTKTEEDEITISAENAFSRDETKQSDTKYKSKQKWK